MKTIIRVAAIPFSLSVLLRGQLRFLNNHYRVVAVASKDEAIHQLVQEREGVETVPIDIERKISLFRDLVSLYRLYIFFRKEKPQIVHSITPKAGLLSMTAAWFAGVPIRIHTFTGLVFPWRSGFMHNLLLFMDKLICRFATHIISEGEGVKRDLIRFKVTNKPLKILANGNVNGIDIEYFKSNSKDTPNDRTKFVFVGRIVKDKGIEELHSAFERLKNCELTLVGDFEQNLNPLSEECFEWAKQYSAGFQEDIRPFLNEADVLVLPSHREGFPNAPLQAGAMGIPSIVSDICGCNEVVVDGKTGLLVKPRDADDLYRAMLRLSKDKELRDEMGKDARQRVVERFSNETVWQALLEFYSEADSFE